MYAPEGPLPPRPHPSGKGGPSIGQSGGGGGPTSVWSASDATATAMTLSNGGLTVTAPTGGHSIRGTVSHTSGKVYVEFLCVASIGSDEFQGVADATFNPAGLVGQSGQSGGANYTGYHVAGSFTANYTLGGVYPNSGDVVGIAVDFAAGSVWLAIRGTWAGSGNPATGASPLFSFVPATAGALFPCLSPVDANDVWTLQATAAAQKYAPPSGFTPWG